MTGRWRSRRWALSVMVLALMAAGCRADGTLTVETEFSDVIDLVPRAPVFAADVRVGTVEVIELTDDHRARVTMEVRDDTGLPAEVKAVLKQTSLLGERMVELVPTRPGGRLSSGFIEDSEVQTDLERLVITGNDLLAFVAADRLNAAVHAGAITFGGRGGTLGQLIGDLEAFVGDYEADKGEVLRLLDALDGLLEPLAREAETNAAAVEALARSTAALSQEDERLLDALEELRRLGVVGERILRDNRDELRDFFAQLQVILHAVTAIDGALQGVLTYLPWHNLHVPNAEKLEFVQIWLDVITCGTSSEERDDPSATCDPPNPGRSNDPPPGTAYGPCDADARGCRFGHTTHNEEPDFSRDGRGDAGGGS
ncbi:MAG: MCE family protein [Actinobacteria bacterium]|nr:MCE family protein [Actinomycetota bacterium]